MADDDHQGPLTAPTSPLGIPSWLWLTLLTFFMLFIIWLSLRNLSHLLPVPVQHAIQDLADRLGLPQHIRLLEQSGTTGSRSGPAGPASNVPFGIDLDGVSSDDDDDELPLASRFNQQDSSFNQTGRRQKLDRIVRLFSGGIQHARGYGNLSSQGEPDDEERVLDLPNLARSSSSYYNKRTDQATPLSSTTLFRADSDEGDAAPLPAQFSLSNARHASSGPLSPSLDRNYPRSPLRSPSLSRTPSLVAIVEETSVSPRTSTEQDNTRTESPTGIASSDLERAGSGSSHSQTLPDWASARSRSSLV